MSSVEVELARTQWEEGSRRFDEEAGDPTRGPRLLAAQEALLDELRRRIGQTFTLAELAAVYADAEDWGRSAISERAAFPGWPAELTTIQDAAFGLYARGATDYEP